jgi:hypothetical protein
MSLHGLLAGWSVEGMDSRRSRAARDCGVATRADASRVQMNTAIHDWKLLADFDDDEELELQNWWLQEDDDQEFINEQENERGYEGLHKRG